MWQGEKVEHQAIYLSRKILKNDFGNDHHRDYTTIILRIVVCCGKITISFSARTPFFWGKQVHKKMGMRIDMY